MDLLFTFLTIYVYALKICALRFKCLEPNSEFPLVFKQLSLFSRSDKVEMFWRTATASPQNMVFTRTCKALSRREMWGLPGTSLPPGGVACMRIETQAFTVFMCVCWVSLWNPVHTAHCSVGTFMECLLCTEQYTGTKCIVLPSFYAKCLFLARFLIFFYASCIFMLQL